MKCKHDWKYGKPQHHGKHSNKPYNRKCRKCGLIHRSKGMIMFWRKVAS